MSWTKAAIKNRAKRTTRGVKNSLAASNKVKELRDIDIMIDEEDERVSKKPRNSDQVVWCGVDTVYLTPADPMKDGCPSVTSIVNTVRLISLSSDG